MARPEVNISEYFIALEKYLNIGCSLHEACLEAKVPYSTIWDYLNEKDEKSGELSEKAQDLKNKIDQAQNIPIVLARKAWVKKLQDGDLNASIEYLKRKRKEEFSERAEIGGDIGIKEIGIKFVN